jgi:hypothetical protein
MFMQWVTEKLIPTFKRLYPENKKDSHRRQCRLPPQTRDWLSVASLSKKKLIEMMVTLNVEYINLPLTNSRPDFAYDDDETIKDRGDCLCIPFNPEEQKNSKSVKTSCCQCNRAQSYICLLPSRQHT